MSTTIRFVPQAGTMNGSLLDVPTFPGEYFGISMPESIGDAAQPSGKTNVTVTWTQDAAGLWSCIGRRAGELSYELSVTPSFDYVDFEYRLSNESNRNWAESLAFNCFNCSNSHSIADHECARHRVRMGNQFTHLTAVPRQFSERPTVQIYNVQGATPVAQIPFATLFHATPPAALEGWIAIESRDGASLVASVSKPTLFLFQNSEYSCIHSAPSFGPLPRGTSGRAMTRLYLVKSPLANWYARMKVELGL